MDKYDITTNHLNVIIRYLNTKPYGEVFQLMTMLNSLPKQISEEGKKGDASEGNRKPKA